MEKPIEHSPKPHNSNGIHYWYGAVLPEELSEFQGVVREVLSGESRKGLYFEKLETGSKKLKLYSVRINQEMRLLLTEQKTDSGNILIALAITKHYKGWEHDADNLQRISACLKRIDKNFTSLVSLAAKPLSSKKQQYLEEGLRKPGIAEVVYFSGNFLRLKADQKDASQMRLPGLLLGLPGTGKTVTAVECLQALHQSHPELKLYYASSHRGLVSEVSKTFAVQYPGTQVTFSSLYTLLEAFFEDRNEHLESAGLWTLSNFLQGQHDAKKQKNIRNQKRASLRFQLSEKTLVSEKIYELLQLIAFYEHQAHVTLANYLKRESGLELDVLLSDLRLYRAYLHEHKLYDWGISNPPTVQASISSSERILVLDEAQNVPPLVLYSLRQIFAHRMLGVGDPYQALSYQPMDLIWSVLQDGLDWRILNQSLRCPAPIVLAAQHVLGLLHVVGGAHIKGYGGYDAVPEKSAGAVESLFKSPSDFSGVHVIFARPELRAAAEKTYGALTPFIHDVEEVGGLAFDRVVLYGFFEPKHLNALSVQDYQAASKAILTHNPSKNSERRADLEAWLHRLLVAMTRATESLFMGITGKTEAERRFMQYLGVGENALKAVTDVCFSNQTLSASTEPYTEDMFAKICSEMEKLLQNGALFLAKRNFELLLKQKRLSRGQVKTLEKILKNESENTPVQVSKLADKPTPPQKVSPEKSTLQFWQQTLSQDPSLLTDDAILEKLFFSGDSLVLRYPELKKYIAELIYEQLRQNNTESLLPLLIGVLNSIERFFIHRISTPPLYPKSHPKKWQYLEFVKAYLRSADRINDKMAGTLQSLESVSLKYHGERTLHLLFAQGNNSLLACFLIYEIRQYVDPDEQQDNVMFKLFQQIAWQVFDNGQAKRLALQYWFEALASIKKNPTYQERVADFEQRLFSQFPSAKWMDLLQDGSLYHDAIRSMPKSFFVRYLPVFWINAKAKNRLLGNVVLVDWLKKLFDTNVTDLISCRRSNMTLLSFLGQDATDARIFYLPQPTVDKFFNLANCIMQGAQPTNSGILTALFSPGLRPYLWGPVYEALNDSLGLHKKEYTLLVTSLISNLQVEIAHEGRICPVWEACLDLEPLLLPKYARNELVRDALHTFVLDHLRKSHVGKEKNPLLRPYDVHNPSIEDLQLASMFSMNAVKICLDADSMERSKLQTYANCSNLFDIIKRSHWPSSPYIQWHEFLRFRDAIEARQPDKILEVCSYFVGLDKARLWKIDKKSFVLALLTFEALSTQPIDMSQKTRDFIAFFEQHFLTLDTLTFILNNQYPFLILREPELPKTCERILLNLSPEVVFQTEILFHDIKITLFDLIYLVLDCILEPWLQKNRQILSQSDNTVFQQGLCKPDILVLMFKKYIVFRESLLSYVENNPQMCQALTEQDIEECDFMEIGATFSRSKDVSREALKVVVKAALEVLKHHPKLLNHNEKLKEFFHFYTDPCDQAERFISVSSTSFFTEDSLAPKPDQSDQSSLSYQP